MPINVVDSSVSHKAMTFRAPDPTDPGPYPIPSNPLIQGGPDITVPGDHHMLIVDRDEKKLYELIIQHFCKMVYGLRIQVRYLICPVIR